MFSFLANFFTNPALVGGAAAASIPIIIHLLNKQQFKRVVWAAMHWLWASYKKSQRRLQIEQLILLIIRCLILILLALALARPALQQGLSLIAGKAPVHRIIVLDNSYSMGQLTGGKVLFDKAKIFAGELVAGLETNDEANVLLTGSIDDGGENLATQDKKDAAARIQAATLSDSGTDLPRAIAAACRVINQRKNRDARAEIIVITDTTRAGWERPDRQPKRLEGAEAMEVTNAFSTTGRKPRITVVRLASDREIDNVAAATIDVDEKVVPAKIETLLIGQVTSFASSTRRDVKVKLKVNGEEVAADLIRELRSGRTEPVMFRHVFPEQGSQAVTLEVEGDSLPVDNTAYLALDVEDQMRVLCVDGQQRVGPNASEMDYFRQALSPAKSEEIQAGRMPLFPEVISDSAFPEANLDNYRLVVFGNVASIPDEKVKALEDFVRLGGSLWIFCGDKVDSRIYNQKLASLLPMPLGDITGSGDPNGASEKLSDADLDHPAVSKFRGIKGLPLNQLMTFRRFRLTPPTEPDPSVRTILAYESGEPAAVEKQIGYGRVVLVSTTGDKAWNNWPEKNHYMPLMNFIALELIQPAYLQRNRRYDEKFSIQLPRQVVGSARREGIRLTDPAGEAQNMEVIPEQSLAESHRLRRAGIYSAVIPGDKPRTLHFAANRNLEESDLTVIEDREITAYFPRADGAAAETNAQIHPSITQADIDFIADDAKALEESSKKGAAGREIWRWLIGMMLVLLVVESLLAKRFGNFNR